MKIISINSWILFIQNLKNRNRNLNDRNLEKKIIEILLFHISEPKISSNESILLLPTMDLLWKRETRHENALYVDLFRKLNSKMSHLFGADAKAHFSTSESMMDQNPRYEKNDAQSILYRKQGDELFHQKKWYEAMKIYNQSLCLAEIRSSNLGIGYAKRAQCFYQLKMYENCLLDLDLARFANYPRPSYELLDIREVECLKLIEERPADSNEGLKAPIVPSLSFKPHDSYPEMANVLEIERNKDSDWQIVAKEDIKVGKIVLVEKSFISMLNQSYDKCCVCSRTLTNLLPCNKCSKVLLCPKCHCGKIHDVECDAEMLFFGNYHSVSDVFRSILLAMSIFKNADDLMNFVKKVVTGDLSQVPDTISDLKTKYRGFLHFAHDSVDLIECGPIAFILFNTLMGHCVVQQFFRTAQHHRFLMHLTFHHQAALKVCGVASPVIGYDNQIEEIDYNLILGVNLNHSCAPHLALKMVEGFAIMITLRPIRKGERVLLAFNELHVFGELEERQQGLLEELGYECDCVRCKIETKNTRIVVKDPKMLRDPDFQFITQHLECDCDGEPEHLDELKKRGEAFLERYGRQEWDECLNAVFICYYYAFKKTHEGFNSLAKIASNQTK